MECKSIKPLVYHLYVLALWVDNVIVGVLKDYKGRGTIALLRALEERTRSYEYIETNFVWDNNVESTLINKRLLGQSCRKFSVYEKEI